MPYDVAVALDVIAGFDSNDLWTGQSLGNLPDEPYVSFIDPNGLKGARVGVLEDSYTLEPSTPEGMALAANSIKVFEDHGAHVVHDLSIGIDLAKYNAANFPAVMSVSAPSITTFRTRAPTIHFAMPPNSY